MGLTRTKGLLVGAGFLLGTIGVKAVTSKPAKEAYVVALTKGLQAKAAGEELLEQAKSNFDDIIAEANYRNEQAAAAATATDTTTTAAVAATAPAAASVAAPTPASKKKK